jgi:predicted ABC-type ATPase
MCVSQGGHDVPNEKLTARFPRILVNLRAALEELPQVWIFDSDDLRTPFRLLAIFESGQQTVTTKDLPSWFTALLKS